MFRMQSEYLSVILEYTVEGLFTPTILFISAGQMLNIGGQTVRLATPGGTLLKAGSTLTGKSKHFN